MTVRLPVERRHFSNSGNPTNCRCPVLEKQMKEMEMETINDDGVFSGDDDDGEEED